MNEEDMAALELEGSRRNISLKPKRSDIPDISDAPQAQREAHPSSQNFEMLPKSFRNEDLRLEIFKDLISKKSFEGIMKQRKLEAFTKTENAPVEEIKQPLPLVKNSPMNNHEKKTDKNEILPETNLPNIVGRDRTYTGERSNSRYKPRQSDYAKDKPVVYKNIFRAIRSNLCKEFKGLIKRRKTFSACLSQFLESFPKIKTELPVIFGEGATGEENFKESLYVFLRTKEFYPNETEETKEVGDKIQK